MKITGVSELYATILGFCSQVQYMYKTVHINVCFKLIYFCQILMHLLLIKNLSVSIKLCKLLIYLLISQHIHMSN